MRKKLIIDPNRLFIDKPLGRYDPNNDWFEKQRAKKPEPEPAPKPGNRQQETGGRQPETGGRQPGTQLDWSRLDLDKVEIMVPKAQGISAFEAVNQAKQKGKIIIPNSVHDRILVETKHWEKIESVYFAWTGTVIIYDDKPLQETVVYKWEDGNNFSISFAVPKQFQGKANCALVVEHPDFDFIETGNNKYQLKAENIHLLENFPQRDGWYHFDERFRIPTGQETDDQGNATRYLFRIQTYLGPLLRGVYDFDYGRYVDADDRPSNGYGVAVIGLEEAEKLKEGSK